MKNSLLGIICFFACILSIQAQTLYGTTPRGGNDGGGTISKFIPATNDLTVAKSFESLAGNPTTNFVQASDGKLYGTTTYGGRYGYDDGFPGYGVIFSFLRLPIIQSWRILTVLMVPVLRAALSRQEMESSMA